MSWSRMAAALVVCAPSLARAEASDAVAKAMAARDAHDSFALAIALHDLGLRQASYGVFSEIADKPNHPKFGATLGWLARLASELPESADVIERVGKYGDREIDAYRSDVPVHAELAYLRGRYAERNRQYEDATRWYARVERTSALYGKATLRAGVVYILERQSVPAMNAFQRVLGWLDGGALGSADEQRKLRDVANLSIARTFYTASFRLDENNSPAVNAFDLSAAMKFFGHVDPTGGSFRDALAGEAWTLFAAGDYAWALGHLELVPTPEAAELTAVILYDLCRYDEANVAASKLDQTFRPRLDEIKHTLEALEKTPEDQQADYVRTLQGASRAAAFDHRVVDLFAYLAQLDTESKRFEALPPAFRSSELGADVKDAIVLAREIVRRNAAVLAREHLLSARDDLNEHLRDATKIRIDITAAQRNQLEGGQTTARDTPAPRTRATLLSWPAGGTTSTLDVADPHGRYRVSVASKCAR